MRVEPRDGRIAGTKTFHYLVVPDSTGSFLLPEIRYPYYDMAAGAYGAATAAPRALAVAPGTEPRAARALPPLMPGTAEVWSDALARDLAPWGWLALLVGPPLVAWLWRRRAAREVAADDELSQDGGAGSDGGGGPARPGRLGRLEREFHGVLASHVPDARARDGDGLARALRAAGIERAVADHVMRLRDRVRAARYGPRGMGDAAELAVELERVLRVLGAEPGAARGRRVGAVLILVMLLAHRTGVAQAPTAEALYEAGALRSAADSFTARVEAQPNVAAHWYNLGATLYRAGADGKAAAAWTRAARLAPRDRVIARARELLPPPDPASDALLAVGPGTPGEWALLAGVVWMALWAAVLTHRR